MARPVSPAIAPPEWSDADVYALKALQQGNANEAQQRRALVWIITGAARTYDVSFHPASDRETSFAEGRRFVGLQIVKLLNLPVEFIKTGPKPNDGG